MSELRELWSITVDAIGMIVIFCAAAACIACPVGLFVFIVRAGWRLAGDL